MKPAASAFFFFSLISSYFLGTNALYRRDPYHDEDSLPIGYARDAAPKTWLENDIYSRQVDFDDLYDIVYNRRDAEPEQNGLYSRDAEPEYYDLYARDADADLWDPNPSLFERDLYDGALPPSSLVRRQPTVVSKLSKLFQEFQLGSLLFKFNQPLKSLQGKQPEMTVVEKIIANKNAARPKNDPIEEVTVV